MTERPTTWAERFIDEQPAAAVVMTGAGLTLLVDTAVLAGRADVPWYVALFCFLLVWWAVGQVAGAIMPIRGD